MEIESILNHYHLYNNKSDDEKQTFNNEISNILIAEEIKIRHKNNFINDQITAKVIQTLVNIGLFVDINYQLYTLPMVKYRIEKENNSYKYGNRTLLQEKLKLSSMLPVTNENVDTIRKILADNNVSESIINLKNNDQTFEMYNNILQRAINNITDLDIFNETPITYFTKALINNNITFEALNSNQLRNEHRLYQLLNNNETYMDTVVFRKRNVDVSKARDEFHRHMKPIAIIKIINEKLEYNKLNNNIPSAKKTSLLTFHGSLGTRFLSLITNGLLTRGDVGLERAGELFGINAVYTGFDLSTLIYKDRYAINENYYDIEQNEEKIMYGDIKTSDDSHETYIYINNIRNNQFTKTLSNRIITYGNRDKIYKTTVNENEYIIIEKNNDSDQYYQYFINYDSSIYVDRDNNKIVIKQTSQNYTLSGGMTDRTFNYASIKYVFQLVVEVDVGSVLVVNTEDPDSVLTKDNLMTIGCDSIIAPRYKIEIDESLETYIAVNGQLILGGNINNFNDPIHHGFMGFKLERYTPLKYLRNEYDKYIPLYNSSSHSLSVFNTNQIAPKYLLVYSREST